MKADYSLLILCLVCIVMVALLFTGPNLSFDDANYLLYAKQILNGTFSYSQNPFAYGYLLPYTIAASIYAWVGFPSLVAASMPAILEYLFLILTIYITSLKLSNKKIALCVGIIAATSAFIAAYSSRILPDLLAGDIVALVIYLLVYTDELHWIRAWAAGALTGLLIFVKLGTLAIALPIIIILSIDPEYWDRINFNPFYYTIGIGIVALIYFATIGFNFSVISNYDAYQIQLDHTNIYTNIETALVFVIPFLAVTSNHIYWQIFPLGLLFDLALIGGYIAFLKKEWEYEKWAIVLVIGFLYLLFGSESLTQYIPITVVSRYFIILALPMAILTTRLLTGLNDFIRYNYKPLTADIVLASIVLIAIIIQVPMLSYFHSYIPTYIGTPLQNGTMHVNIIGRPNMS